MNLTLRVITYHLVSTIIALTAVARAGTLAKLTIQPEKVTEIPEFTLKWDSVPGVLYRVQHSATLLGNNQNWLSADAVIADGTNSSVQIKGRSIPENSFDFFRLEAHPEIFTVEPAFVDSSDTNAVLYILGQLLPTNATIVINGQNFTPTILNSNGVWATVRLNGLPPGEPVIGTLTVIDNGTSNVVATLPVQGPILYGTTMTTEQLQGPPDDPPASPARAKITKSRSNIQNNRVGSGLMDSIRENDNVVFEVREGKKGLNAVDVKKVLRVAGGGDCDDSDDGVFPWGHIAPAAMKAKEKGSRTKCASNLREINPATGELRCEETDLIIPGRGLDFAWTRTYLSRTGPDTAQGHGWDFSYNVSLTQQPNGTLVLRSGNGRADTFYPNGTNGWSRDEYFSEIHAVDIDQDGTPDFFEMVFSENSTWRFNPINAFDPSGGKLSQIVDRNGNTMTLGYDTAGKLITIVDDLDRTNTIVYNSSGQLASVTDFSGRVVRYEYNTAGDLIACISPAVIGTPNGNDFPGGKTNLYTYTSGFPFALDQLNHNLTSCTDAKGQTWLQVVYQATVNPASLDFDAVAYTSRGIDRKDVWRKQLTPSPANGFATVQSIVRDPVGNVTEYFYDSRLRCVRQLEYTGRSNTDSPVTDVSNRPQNKLRSDDPDFYETQWTWNPDSLCTSATALGDGNGRITRVRLVYSRDLTPNTIGARKKGDLMVVRQYASSEGVDSNGDGVADTTERAWHFEYDDRFGSSPSTRAGGRIICNYVRREKVGINETLPYSTLHARGPRQSTSLDGTFANNDDTLDVVFGTGMGKTEKAKIIMDRDTGRSKGFGFVTSATDPNGIVMTAGYDANGNATNRTYQPGKPVFGNLTAEDYTYNSYGQLTSVSNAPDANGRHFLERYVYSDDPFTSPTEPANVIIDAGPGGLNLTNHFDYDLVGNVTAMMDARGNDWRFTWNALDECVRMETPTNLTSRCVTDLTYDENDNLVQTSTELRDDLDAIKAYYVSVHRYDVFDRCIADVNQVSAKSFVTNGNSYDGNDQVVATYSPLAMSGVDPHHYVTFEYDERGLPFRTISAPGSGISQTNQWDYDFRGNVRVAHNFVVGPNYDRLYVYDGFARPVTVMDAGSNSITYAYDRNDNVILEKTTGALNDGVTLGSVRLREWRWKYDGLDRLSESREMLFDPATQASIGDGVALTTYTYAPNGQCLSITDDNAHTTTFAYDQIGDLSRVSSPSQRTEFAILRDRTRNMTQCTQTDRSDIAGPTQVFEQNFAYDSRNRRVADWDNVGNTNRYAYDSLDNLVSHLTPRQDETFCAFDGLNRLTSTTNFVGKNRAVTISTSHVEYDTANRVTAVTDSNGNTTHCDYDSLDRVIQTTEADGTTCSLIWSPRSNLTLRQDANGTVISNSFDVLDRCIRRDITPGPGVAASTTFETFAYDGLSHLVGATNNSSITRIAFASSGQCSSTRLNGRQVSYLYDGVGNLISMTYPSGLVVSNTFNDVDDVSSVTTLGGGKLPTLVASFSYDGPGRVAAITRANGVGTRLNWNGTVNPANASGDFGSRQVRRVNHQKASTVIDQRLAAFDQNQNRILRAQTVPFYVGGNTRTNGMDYDALDRVTYAWTVKPTEIQDTYTFTVDAVGNRQLVTSNGVAGVYTMDNASPPADFQMNQYTTTPFASQVHDENGNIVSRTSSAAQLAFEYDYADQLVSVTDLSTGMAVPVASYAYDTFGNCISKTIYPPSLPPVTTDYVYGGAPCRYSGQEICEEYVGVALSATHVWDSVSHGNRRYTGDSSICTAARYTGDSHICTAARHLIQIRGGQTYFTHADDLGNVLALTDAAGNVVERYDYDAFGAPQFLNSDGFLVATNTSTVGNPFLFHGMQWDDETGFYLSKEFSTAHDQPKGSPRHRTLPVDPKTGEPASRPGKGTRKPDELVFNVLNPKGARNNPWSTGGAGGGGGGCGGMNRESRLILESYFETGDVPTQEQFSTMLDSMVNLVDDRNLLGLRTCQACPKGGVTPGGEGMKKGTVKFFNETKGFGMIVSGGGSDRVAIRPIRFELK